MRVLLRVTRCYKSEGAACPNTVKFFYDWPPFGNWSHRLTIGDDAVVLLTDRDGKLTAEDPDGIWSMNGLVQTLHRSEEGLAPRGKAGLQEDISNTLTSPDRELRQEAFFYLRGFSNLQPGTMAEAKRITLTASAPMGDRLAALDLMLIDPQPEPVAIAARIAETEGIIINTAPVVNEIGLSLQNASNPRCIPDLIKILESSVVNWHYGAISGIRKIGGSVAVPSLIKALDEQDLLTRYSAVITLFEATKMTDGLEYGPGLGAFERDEGKYVKRWKQWWASDGRAKYEQPANKTQSNRQ